MAFSSNFFLFGFLPFVIAIYILSPNSLRNAVLLAASLVFYAFDAGWLVWLLLASIALNHVVAQGFLRLTGVRRDALFIIGVTLNLAGQVTGELHADAGTKSYMTQLPSIVSCV